jgi:hypothetical protein
MGNRGTSGNQGLPDLPADDKKFDWLGNVFRNPLVIGLAALGAVATAFQVAGITNMLLAKLILIAGVWALLTIEVCCSNWIRKTGRYAFSIVLLSCCLSGLVSLQLAITINRLQIHYAPIASIQLFPAIDETKPQDPGITGAVVIFTNNRTQTLKNFRQLIFFPPIKSASPITMGNQNPVVILAGNQEGSKFLDFSVPDLKPGEIAMASVGFQEPQPFTSADVWAKQYGNGEDVLVYREFVLRGR